MPVKKINCQNAKQHGDRVELPPFQFELESIGKNGNPKYEQDDETISLTGDKKWEQTCEDKIADHGDERDRIIIDRIP